MSQMQAIALNSIPQDSVRRADRGAPRSATAWVTLGVLCAPVLGVTLLAKFGLPPFAQEGFGIALPLIVFALAFGALQDCVRIDPRRFGFYCLMLAALCLPQLLRAGPFSETSLLMLAAVHLPYVVVVSGGHERTKQVLSFFRGIATLLAVLAIAQYFLQSVVNPALLFPIDNFVPSAFLVQGFNAQSFIHYGSDLYRATGVFMLEPSFLTQYLAVAIVAEAVDSRRIFRMALYGIGIVTAHAGTGLLILMVCLPIAVLVYRRWDLLLLGCVGLAALIGAADVLNLEMITSRVNEFSDPKSSGFARFVGGFYLFDQMLWPEPSRALFGYGAGAFMEHTHLFQREVADMPLTKMVFEFGLVGAAVYFTFLLSCLFSSPLPRLIALAIALTFFLNGIYVPFSHGLALSLLVFSSIPASQRHTTVRDLRPAAA
jgi:hypothetical protein